MGHKNFNDKNKNKKQDIKDVDNLDSTNNGENELDSKDLLKEKDLKIKELEDRYVRAYAEFENVKKRLEREKYQSLEYANEMILKDLLPVLDTLESALNGIDLDSKDSTDSANLKEKLQSVKNGIQLTLENFLKALNKHGITPIPADKEFDPNLHNAIMQVKDESKNDGEISQVMQKGYKYKERVIRPSMVSITKNN
ncbi:nucleotide exchange factor GrpE [Helicobacter sp. 16-1353]|uniref:nucleotide exchange factor GrpE n=1 Tax=Helicobacter sp. 16-1353 TaxID=2004996 RepID=UPI000DCCA843|nr:nucleotide exchange factor GrpE [Helicobacter sp. 16-1353]RAX53139.1 nucleotide exchange factor GrpE [Helicobacter sp. 16-1353]